MTIHDVIYDVIRDTDGKWYVVDEDDNDKIAGPFDTEEEAWDAVDDVYLIEDEDES